MNCQDAPMLRDHEPQSRARRMREAGLRAVACPDCGQQAWEEPELVRTTACGLVTRERPVQCPGCRAEALRAQRVEVGWRGWRRRHRASQPQASPRCCEPPEAMRSRTRLRPLLVGRARWLFRGLEP